MKRILIATAVIGVLLTFQQAHAGQGWQGPGPGCPYSWNDGYPDEATSKKMDGFLKSTVDLRKRLAVKQAEYQALMMSATPDPDKAGALTSEIFDLRNQLHDKAVEAGLPAGPGRGGYPCRGGWGNGYGRGYGNGPGPGRGFCRGYMY